MACKNLVTLDLLTAVYLLLCEGVAVSNESLLLHVAASLVFVAAAGRGIGWALDTWVRLAPTDTKH
ncbi:hypothetical protein OPKNFCMD_5275 [Methylobacterium crusticola]|uniref:Uncharacterized protein n=1 Tax=Methylobacterium crusticola TaxID=1697972 RepID=A0ABQ4R5T7_9HYPH|nr:hypothetical protein OPKNFCMD_5275 [Methylobacterium crusticola]